MIQTEILILLLHWNTFDLTKSCILDLRKRGVLLNILVIDNCSKDASKKRLTTLGSGVEFLYLDENKGFSGANNEGMKWAIEKGYQFVFLLNTDAQISLKTIQRLYTNIRENRNIGIIGPCMREGSGDSFVDYIGGRDIAHHINTRVKREGTQTSRDLQNVDYVPGTACLLRLDTIKKIGFFDEYYFFSGEMADWCKRVRQTEGQCKVLATHYIEHFTDKTPSDRRNSLYLYYSLRNRFLYIRKFYKKEKGSLFIKWIWVGFRQILGAIIQGDFNKTRAILLALFHGLIGRYGNGNAHFTNSSKHTN